jgi:hypothetical protein
LPDSLRWLLPPEKERWVGYLQGESVAEVWSHGLTGNQIIEWRWKLTQTDEAGFVMGTGEDDRDRYSAQSAASLAYVAKQDPVEE